MNRRYLLVTILCLVSLTQAEQRVIRLTLGSWPSLNYKGRVKSIVEDGHRVEINPAQTRATFQGGGNYTASLVLDVHKRTFTLDSDHGRLKLVEMLDSSGCHIRTITDATAAAPSTDSRHTETQRRCATGGWVIQETDHLAPDFVLRRQIRWSADHRQQVITESESGSQTTRRFNSQGDLIYEAQKLTDMWTVNTTTYTYDSRGNWITKSERITESYAGVEQKPILLYTRRKLTYYP